MAYHVLQANFQRRIKTVSLWSLQQTTSAVLSTLRLVADPIQAHMRVMYRNLDDAISLESLGHYVSLKPGATDT
jgi:distribution and morphology protein 31